MDNKHIAKRLKEIANSLLTENRTADSNMAQIAKDWNRDVFDRVLEEVKDRMVAKYPKQIYIEPLEPLPEPEIKGNTIYWPNLDENDIKFKTDTTVKVPEIKEVALDTIRDMDDLMEELGDIDDDDLYELFEEIINDALKRALDTRKIIKFVIPGGEYEADGKYDLTIESDEFFPEDAELGYYSGELYLTNVDEILDDISGSTSHRL